MIHRTKFYSAIAPVVLVFAIFGNTITLPACNSKKTLDEAAEAAKDIGGGTRDTIKKVGEAYDLKLITIAQKDKLADVLIQIAKGGQKGVEVLSSLEASGITELDADQRTQLNKLFDIEVVTPFLQLISELAKLSDAQSSAIRAALVGVRLAIMLFSQKIGRNDIELLIRQREIQHA